jgi:protease II
MFSERGHVASLLAMTRSQVPVKSITYAPISLKDRRHHQKLQRITMKIPMRQLRLMLLCLTVAYAYADASKVESRSEGALSLENVPALDSADQRALRPYLEARTGTSFGWLPHGDGVLIGARFGNTQQLHKVMMPMGARTQLSFEEEPILSAYCNHNTQAPGMIYARDTGGDEQFQLYYFDFITQSKALLSEGAATRNETPVYAPDGWHFAYARTNATGNYQIRFGDTRQAGQTRAVFEAPGTWYVMDIAADNNRLILQNYRSILDSNLIELNLKTGKRLPISLPKGRANGSAQYAPDGKSIYFLSDQGEEFLHLRQFDLAKKSATQISAPMLRDIEEFSVNADASLIALNINFDGNSEVQVFNPKDFSKAVASASAKPGVVSGIRFHPSENRLVMTLSGGQTPGDTFVLDVASQQMSRWTTHELGGMRSFEMALPTLFSYVGGSDKSAYHIEGLFYRPIGAGPFPVLVILHGGPESQSRPSFDPWLQYLVRELKIAVLLPNVRGSTGYGRKFTEMDDADKRKDAVADLGSLLDWIATQKDFDAKRVALMGGSYGGFMTLAGLVNYSAQLAGGVDIVGISDFETFLKNTSNYRRDLRRVEYGDERLPAMKKFFAEISPLKNAALIKAPLFVIQGANDPRVPASEARQIVQAVRANDVEVWAMTAADEGHGFKKKANADRMRLAVVAFLKKHLLAD